MTHPEFDVMLSTCPSRTSLARIANKWTAMIIIALGGGRMRFTELRATVAGISGKVLADTLRDLERDGLVSRHAFAEVPPRVEYELTPLGETLSHPLAALRAWAEAHHDEVARHREAYDDREAARSLRKN